MGKTMSRKKGFSVNIHKYENQLVATGRWRDTKRNSHMRFLITNHFGMCQSCNIPAVPTRGSNSLQGAHINPKTDDGYYDNTARNILCLCPQCHIVYDKGFQKDTKQIAWNVQSNYPNIGYKWPKWQKRPNTFKRMLMKCKCCC